MSAKFGGDTIVPERDTKRLTRQLVDVYVEMQDGRWYSLGWLSQKLGYPQQSISARIRDFRKKKFGASKVERKYLGGGLYNYRLVASLETTDIISDLTE